MGWIIPLVLLGGMVGLFYLMAKKGIGCCGSMMSGGCGMGTDDQTQESPQPKGEARTPTRARREALVARENGHPTER